VAEADTQEEAASPHPNMLICRLGLGCPTFAFIKFVVDLMANVVVVPVD
jgi:hypothetical protein